MLHMLTAIVRGVSRKFLASYIKKKYNNSNQLIFLHNLRELQCTYSVISAAYVFQSCNRALHALKESPPRRTQWRHYHLKIVCHTSIIWTVVMSQQTESQTVFDLVEYGGGGNNLYLHSVQQTSQHRGGVGRHVIMKQKTPCCGFPRGFLWLEYKSCRYDGISALKFAKIT